MCRNGIAKQITVDHEPLKEKQQVESRGGFVSQMPGTMLCFFLLFVVGNRTITIDTGRYYRTSVVILLILGESPVIAYAKRIDSKTNETRQIFWSEFHDTSCTSGSANLFCDMAVYLRNRTSFFWVLRAQVHSLTFHIRSFRKNKTNQHKISKGTNIGSEILWYVITCQVHS